MTKSMLPFGIMVLALAAPVAAASSTQAPPPRIPRLPIAPVMFHADLEGYTCEVGAPMATAPQLVDFGERHRGDPIDHGTYEFPTERGNFELAMPAGAVGNHGVVTAKVAVSEHGKVLDVLLECSTDPSLGAAATAAIRAAAFDPASKEGTSVAGMTTVAVYFER